jgi:hypothetical protein
MLLRRQIMTISAMYICPVNGAIDFKPPDPGRLNSAAGTARDLGLEKLWLPVVEESLMLPSRDMTRYLDGIIQDLDIIADIGLSAGVIAPARNILGLDFIPPHLAKSFPDPNATRFLQPGNCAISDLSPGGRICISCIKGWPCSGNWSALCTVIPP